MIPLPSAPLCLAAPADRSLPALLRKTRLRALRALLGALPGPAQAALAARARRDPEPLLAAIGAPDVLPALLFLEAHLRPPGPLLAQAQAALDHPEQTPQVPLTHGLHPALADTNPLRDIEAHPDKSGNALDLGGHDPADWAARLSEALDLIALALPEWMAEHEQTLHRLLPVGYAPERHFSATYREAPGTAYLSLHPDPLTLAEAIVHEGQHSRLNLLHLFDPILENGATTWTASPVRPDLRPLIGVLLAVHAFVPVAALHARLAALDHPLATTARFAERRAQVLAGNARGLELVATLGQPTPQGRRVIDGLQALHAHLLPLVPDAPGMAAAPI